ncbi:MAG TPA: YggS family pyridoxal phosphate-dependent enzyme, partial [Aequorivita sp.]|nr:YggS family pyridoxal phosphate-dependent enzyme [Aequorivita sp.]
KNNRTINCLLQVKIAEEESKFGMDEADAASLLASEAFKKLQNVKVVGLMGMATFTDDERQISEEFQKLKDVFEKFKVQDSRFKILSMGMSGDYKIAIEHGSNMVRVGSAIFGERNYE